MLRKKNILGVGITGESAKSTLEYVGKRLQGAKKFFIVTPNPEILVYASRHEYYKKVLNDAEIALPDGVGVLIASKILGEPLTERVTGVDFIEKLCRESKDHPISMGFLGGKPKIAERAAECLREKYPWIEVVFAGEEWSEFLPSARGPVDAHRGTKQNNTRKNAEGVSVVQRLGQRSSALATIDILFVAYGAPKQEEWIAANLEQLPVKAAMGVGGAFDYLSGEVGRAPVWVQKIGFEWFYRLIRQPWRWRRQLALVEFIWLVLKERFR